MVFKFYKNTNVTVVKFIYHILLCIYIKNLNIKDNILLENTQKKFNFKLRVKNLTKQKLMLMTIHK